MASSTLSKRPITKLEVECLEDGSAVIRADAYTAARLAGRDRFGSVKEVQAKLLNLIADAWYAAGCPSDS